MSVLSDYRENMDIYHLLSFKWLRLVTYFILQLQIMFSFPYFHVILGNFVLFLILLINTAVFFAPEFYKNHFYDIEKFKFLQIILIHLIFKWVLRKVV